MLSESSPKDDDTKLFSMVDKWLKNARIEYNGNHQGFAEYVFLPVSLSNTS